MHVSNLKLAGGLFNAVLSFPSSGTPCDLLRRNWSSKLLRVPFTMARRSRMSPMIGFSGNTLNTLARIFEQAPAKLASGLLPGGPCPHSKFGGGCQTLSDQNQRERNALRVRLRDEQALDPLTFKFD